MVLDQMRKLGDVFLIPMAKLFIRVNPNYITVVSFFFAVLAGASFAVSNIWTLPPSLWRIPIILIVGSLFVVFSGVLDLLDGKVARMTGKSSKRGDFLDHMFDRYSDTVIIIGIAFSGYIIWPLGFLAIASILIASYMGTQAQALGLGRDYKGVMGRADRIFLLIFFPVIHLLIYPFIEDGNLLFFISDGGGGVFKSFFEYIDYRFTILDLLMIVFIIGGQQTAIQRAISIWRGLGNGDEGAKAGKEDAKAGNEEEEAVKKGSGSKKGKKGKRGQ